jgi:hypothetical protein
MRVASDRTCASGEAVDVVLPSERCADVVDVVLVQLLWVVKLVAVDQVAEPFDRAPDTVDRGLRCVLGLVTARDEASDHGPECPDAERGLHVAPSWAVGPPSSLAP